MFFESCKVIKGFKKSIILDFQRNKIFNVPNSFKYFIDKTNKTSLNELYEKYGSESKAILDEYVNFIEENELGAFLSKEEKKSFPVLDTSWFMHSHITNCCIEISKIDSEFLNRLENIFILCNIQSVLFKFEMFDNDQILSLLEFINISVLKECEIIFFSPLGLNKKVISDIAFQSLKINRFYIYGSKKNLIVNSKTYDTYYINQSYDAIREESLSNFYPHIDFKFNNYTESQKHNLYFNRKLYVSSEGEIKNAFELDERYGSIHHLKEPKDIYEIINNKEFKKYWHVIKNETFVCKDCEFRYICIDNRVPLQADNNSWYYENECAYNPYIAKWIGEDGYKSLLESGITINKQKLKMDRRKLNKVNEEIWGCE